MRAGTGANKSRIGGPEAGDDGLHSVDGGSSDSVSRVSPHAQVFDDCSAVSRQDGAGATSVQEAPWFEPVEDNGCKDGVCPVSWATKPYRPSLKPDVINHPSHYLDGGIECIEAIEAQLTFEEYRGYLKGNIAKYVWRERHKGGTESLKKARWYLDRVIELDELNQNG
jgi:hypothetical protein